MAATRNRESRDIIVAFVYYIDVCVCVWCGNTSSFEEENSLLLKPVYTSKSFPFILCRSSRNVINYIATTWIYVATSDPTIFLKNYSRNKLWYVKSTIQLFLPRFQTFSLLSGRIFCSSLAWRLNFQSYFMMMIY